jgi:hypothetical protein
MMKLFNAMPTPSPMTQAEAAAMQAREAMRKEPLPPPARLLTEIATALVIFAAVITFVAAMFE